MPVQAVLICLTLLVASPTILVAQIPTLTGTTPGAVTPGETLDLIVKGANLQDARTLWTSFPAEVSLTPDVKDNGKQANQVSFRVKVPVDAPVGVHGIRVATSKGVSKMWLLVVDDLKSVAQQANKTKTTAQKITLPIAVDGNVDSLSRHYFRFTAQVNQRLSFEVLARRIGSPLDPVIRLLDREGREITYSDDAPGQGGDARLCHTFAEAGDYLLEVRDIQYRGGGNYRYRLRIGDFPCITVPYPLGIQKGQPTKISFAGSDLEDVGTNFIQVPTESTEKQIHIGAKHQQGQICGFGTLIVSDTPELLETEPNNTADQATQVALTADWNGRLNQNRDVDYFQFQGKKGQKVRFTAVARLLGSPVDLVLKVHNASGKKLAEADDVGTDDAQLNYTIPVDGIYLLSVNDLHHRSGPELAYRIAVSTTHSSFELDLDNESINVPLGGVASVTVNAKRSGYNGPISLAVTGLPEQIRAMPTSIGPGQTSAMLTLVCATTDPEQIKDFNLASIQVIGTGSDQTTAAASTSAAISASQNATPRLPYPLLNSVAVGVTNAPNYTLRIEPQQVKLSRDFKAKIKVIATRKPGFDEPITLAFNPAKNALPGGLGIALKPILKGQNEVELEVTANNKSPFGDFSVLIQGTLKKGNANHVHPAPGLLIGMQQSPYTLSLDVATGEIVKGGELKIKAKVQRISAFTGPIVITLENLPKGVTAPKSTLPANQNEIEIILTAAAEATPANITNLIAKGEGQMGNAKFPVTSSATTLTVK